MTALSETQLAILRLIAEGHTNRAIGHALNRSEDGVKTGCRRLFLKLGARDRAHAVHIGHQTGLLQ